MEEMKSLTLNGKKYDSFPDQTARENLNKKIPIPAGGAVVGQYLRVAAVDDTGNITAVETVTIDSELSETSENPVQNKVVADAIRKFSYENANKGAGWTTAQIDLLDSLLSHINYTDTEGGAIADQLIASLRGGIHDDPVDPTDDITQSGSNLTIVSGVTATQTSNVLVIA